jgi:hypothetical protein
MLNACGLRTWLWCLGVGFIGRLLGLPIIALVLFLGNLYRSRMKRSLSDIYAILLGVLEKEAEGSPTFFDPERIADDETREAMSYFVPMLIENGFLRKVENQPDYEGFNGYRLTWKGHCFMDLFETMANARKSKDLSAILIADTALASFY